MEWLSIINLINWDKKSNRIYIYNYPQLVSIKNGEKISIYLLY